PNSSRNININFPSNFSAGVYGGSLFFKDNKISAIPTGDQIIVEVPYTVNLLPIGSKLTTSTTSISQTVAQNGFPSSTTFTVGNTGDAEMNATISVVSIDTPGSWLSINPTNVNVGPNSSQTITVEFDYIPNGIDDPADMPFGN